MNYENTPTSKQNSHAVVAKIFFALVLAFIAVLAFVQSDAWLKNQKQALRSQAVDACMQAARIESSRYIESEGKDVKAYEPVRAIYSYCLVDKGFVPTEEY